MPTRKNFPGTVERKRKEGQARQAESDKLTPKQKVEKLDKLFGVDQGAKKERKKLAVKVLSPVFIEPGEPVQKPKKVKK